MNPKLLSIALCGCLIAPLSLSAQEVKRIEGDQARMLTKILTTATAQMKDLPVKLALDEERGTGLHAGGAAAFIVPNTKLTAEGLKKVDKEIVPVGVLYLHKATVVVADQVVPAAQHRTVEITVENQKATVVVLPLAVTRVAGRLVLLTYTNDKTPALVTELVAADEASDLPLNLDGRSVGPNRAALVVNVLGRYRAAIPVAGQE